MLKRFLKALFSSRSVSSPLVAQSEPHEEERIALSAYATFDSQEFARRTGYRVRNEEYFLQAVIHRSYLHMCPPGSFQSNERMEFLGDSVLGLIVAEYLYHTMPLAEEGELSKIRSRLVNRHALGECARRLEFEDFVLMSPSARQSIRDGSDSILVDVVEAFIAAIYLDGGYNAVRTFLQQHLLGEYSVKRLTRDENYKSRLLEYTQGKGLGTPRYVLLEESGPDHSPVFNMEVQVGGIPVGSGSGGNKKTAEQIAASEALHHFQDKDT
jgi:ribonuclease III